MDKKRIIEMRGKGQALSATVHVGKEGVTDTIVEEVCRQLKKHKLVKIRLLPAFETERHQAGTELATKSESVLVEVRGRTVLLAKD